VDALLRRATGQRLAGLDETGTGTPGQTGQQDAEVQTGKIPDVPSSGKDKSER
jgi:hypothetical protein